MANLIFINDISNKSLCNEKYFVDTNIWVYYAYMSHKTYQLEGDKKDKFDYYSRFIEKVIEDKGELFTSSLCLSELSNVIENQALKQYNIRNNMSFNSKQFRAVEEERKLIINDISHAWDSIKDVATIIEHLISKETGDNIINEIKIAPLDPYDAIFLQIIKNKKINNIITDDKDFQKISSNVDIYTFRS